MKKNYFIALFALLFMQAQAQYYTLPGMSGNPSALNQDDENPLAGATGWTTIIPASTFAPTWSAQQAIPFSFQFNGESVSSFVVSSTGVLTFAANPGAAPTVTAQALPNGAIPDKSVVVWGLESSGTNDGVGTKTFGSAPNREHWIWFASCTVPGLQGWTYWAIVLEETTNNIYIVDQRTSSPAPIHSVGVQINAQTAYMVAGSPTLSSLSVDDPSTADNTTYAFYPGVPPAYDINLTNVSLGENVLIKNAPYWITGELVNVGSTNIDKCFISYQVDSDPVQHAVANGLGLAFGASGKAANNIPWTPAAAGTYQVKIWVHKPNGIEWEDNNDPANMITKTVVVSDGVERIPLYETFTSSTCPPCVPANTNMEILFGINKGRQTSLKYQMSWPGAGDPYFTDEGGDRRTYYQVSSVPNVAIDGGWNDNGNNLSQDVMNQFASVPAFMTLDASHVVTGNKVDVTVNANFLKDFNSSQNTLHVAIFEKRTTNNIGSNGETEFMHVMKKMLPDANGTNIGAQTAGNQSWNMSYTFNGSYRLSSSAQDPINHATEHSIEDFNNLGVAVWIQDNGTKEVFQSANDGETIGIAENEGIEFNIYPNPANDVVNVRFEEFGNNANVSMMNALGQVVLSQNLERVAMGETVEFNVSSLDAGVYFITINSEEKTTTQRVVIQ